MELLLDTHVLLWWCSDDAAVGKRARDAIANRDSIVYVSAASAWEIAVKRASGKLDAPGDVAEWLQVNDFLPLDIGVGHALRSAELPNHHRDPFDRLLIAQSEIEELTLVTADPVVASYDIETLDASL